MKSEASIQESGLSTDKSLGKTSSDAFNYLKEVFVQEDVLCVDKPLRWTSFDALNYLKKAFHLPKVGHAGTLDPLATGLLILCVGNACKRISYFQQMDKTYEGLFCLGERRSSHDLECAISQQQDTSSCRVDTLEQLLKQYIGRIEQRPPRFSAVKFNGRRAYQYARRQEEIELPSRTVEIYEFETSRVYLPWVSFRVRCSKGTYIRSLVRDIGESLGCGAALHALRRTRIGNIGLEGALRPDVLKESLSHR